jgi:hypothetical protein
MSWAGRLKRVFGVQIESCARCGGELKIIASIEEPQLIAQPEIKAPQIGLREVGPRKCQGSVSALIDIF